MLCNVLVLSCIATGDWQTRVAWAFRAYFEWLPISQLCADKERFYRYVT
jgi:phosphodiesterase/alkaline phosphatase D-like protein